MLTYPWKCTVLHCNHLGNTWKPLVLMTRHFDYCPSTSEGDNQSVRSSAPVVSRCFPGGYNVKLYISRGRLAWWLLAFLCCDMAHAGFVCILGYIFPCQSVRDDDKVSMLTYTYPCPPPRGRLKIKFAICNHQVDCPFCLWPKVCSGDLQAKKEQWLYTAPNVLTETRRQ